MGFPDGSVTPLMEPWRVQFSARIKEHDNMLRAIEKGPPVSRVDTIRSLQTQGDAPDGNAGEDDPFPVRADGSYRAV